MKNGDGVAIYVWVVPGVHKPGISGLHGEKVRVRVGAPPEGGRAKVFVAADIDVEDAAQRLGAH